MSARKGRGGRTPGARDAAAGRREAAAGLTPGERSLLGFFGAAWAVSVLHLAGLLPLAGAFALSLYAYYAFAAGAGWLAGNVFVLRRRRGGRQGAGLRGSAGAGRGSADGAAGGERGAGRPAAGRRDVPLLAILYFFGPPSLVYLLRALAPPEHQQAAPLAPLWAFGVYGVFFLVPIVLPPPVRSQGRRR